MGKKYGFYTAQGLAGIGDLFNHACRATHRRHRQNDKFRKKPLQFNCFFLSIEKFFAGFTFPSCDFTGCFPIVFIFLHFFISQLSYILKLHSFLRRFLSIIHEFCFFSSLPAGDIISAQSKERITGKFPHFPPKRASAAGGASSFFCQETHDGGCAIVRPGCRVFFFFVDFVQTALTDARRVVIMISIYRGTDVRSARNAELRRLKPDPLNLSVNTVVGSKGTIRLRFPDMR